MARNRKQLSFLLLCLAAALLLGCAGEGKRTQGLGNGWEPEKSLTLHYAKNFSVDYYAGDYRLLSLENGRRFLVIPEGGEAPAGIDEDIVVLQAPIQNIYLAASGAMCHLNALDALSSIRYSGIQAEGWYLDEPREAMERGEILFSGKYSAPDYERLLSGNCPLAIESTMIGHAPEVEEKLEELGIPVFIDLSSSEPEPLGRTEWIKAYGALLNLDAAAEAAFRAQEALASSIDCNGETEKTVAFFYVNAAGTVVTKKSSDYIPKMIEAAGGRYIFDDLGDAEAKSSSVNMTMEAFYAAAKDADYLVYNASIDNPLSSIEALKAKDALFCDFRAVQDGNVWCTTKYLYQASDEIGSIIRDFNRMLLGEAPDSDGFLYPLAHTDSAVPHA